VGGAEYEIHRGRQPCRLESRLRRRGSVDCDLTAAARQLSEHCRADNPHTAHRTHGITVTQRDAFTQVPAVADGPARRAASRAWCCGRSVRQMNGQSRRSNVDCCKYCQPTTTASLSHRASSVNCRTKFTICCDSRRAVAKFSKSRVLDKVPLTTGDTEIGLPGFP